MASSSSSALFSKILNRLQSNLIPSAAAAGATFTTRQAYHKSSKMKAASRNNLFARILPIGNPDANLAPVLDEWVMEGKKISKYLLPTIVKGLRAQRRYTHALQVSEWMNSKGIYPITTSDHAVRMDLIGKVRGLESAETYFKDLDDPDKNDKTYGALLSCYVRGGLIDKSLSHVQKMKDLRFASNLLVYKNLMCLYANTGQFEKVPELLLEMKKNGVSPDNFSYRVCLNSYDSLSNLRNVEKLVEEMETQPHISMDWTTYSVVSRIYIKAGLKDVALKYLKKCEERVDRDSMGYNHLIALYASLGIKDEVMRLWGLAKEKCKKQKNGDYITMLGSLVKFDEFKEAEKLLAEWESTCYFYDFRVPNVLLIGYCQKGLVLKAESLLCSILENGKTPTPNSWAILAAAYSDLQNMENAFRCMKEALVVQAENKGWRPKQELISSVLSWLGDNGNVEQVEEFLRLLDTKFSRSREACHVLLKVYIREGKEVGGILVTMKANDIQEDEETKVILRLRQEEC